MYIAIISLHRGSSSSSQRRDSTPDTAPQAQQTGSALPAVNHFLDATYHARQRINVT